jgi:type III restriction enzyme
MITVANRTETAARIKYAFEHKRIRTEELCDTSYLIHIDSKTLEKAEAENSPLITQIDADKENAETLISENQRNQRTHTEQAIILRETVDTVGQIGKRGEQVRNVISVGMLTEGWDA